MPEPTHVLKYFVAATPTGLDEIKRVLKEQRATFGWKGRVRTATRAIRARGHRFTVYVGWVEDEAPGHEAGPIPPAE